jgi:thiol-disulfide isomerase/thioredoxin
VKLPRVRAPELPAGLDWLNTSETPTLSRLRGRFVLLDFWTSACVNCLHALEDLVQLERLFPDELVVLGIHSAKFEHEGELEALKRSIQRHGIEHPVANDPSLSLWREHAVRAWPTLVLIDPEGYAITRQSGEQVFEPFAQLIQALLPVYAERGSLKPAAWSLEPVKTPASELLFPSKVLVHGDRLVIADSGRHRLLIADLDGTVRQVIGSGEPGHADGAYGEASFRFPQGLASRGDELFVADTDNHLLRRVDLLERRVETIGGTGERAFVPRARGPARDTPLSSPWDLELLGDELLVAHSGTHQVWSLELATGTLGARAGSGAEGREDGPFEDAQFAQPSALAVDGGSVFVVDAETSSVRALDFAGESVRTVAGGQLFEFGYVDNVGDAARFQHPTGLTAARGKLVVADTYNHALREVDPKTGEVTTLIGQREEAQRHGDGRGVPDFLNGPSEAARLAEPTGLSVWKDRLLFVADSGNHAVRVFDFEKDSLATLSLDFGEAG